VSHLPHLLAFALISSISSQNEARDFLSLAGPGFRDFTRIAASDPNMWRDIMMANRNELLAQTEMFKQTLAALESMIASGNGDALEGVLKLASQARSRWHMTSHKSAK
jgi:prephenate dehydrogenase